MKCINDKGSALFRNGKSESRQPSTLNMKKEERQQGTAGEEQKPLEVDLL